MARKLALATLFFVIPVACSAQALSVLHIKVVLADVNQAPTPVPRHALLVSDNPSTAAPRRILTGPDGTADVRLRPGNYTIESDRAVAFHGKAYQWTQVVDIVAGRDAVLELTAANAEIAAATDASDIAAGVPSLEADPVFLLPKWQDSVVALWTPTTRASGFVVDANGLIVTNQRLIGSVTSLEVQFTATLKVAARVVAADAARDVAILWIDPMVAASVPAVPLNCGGTTKASVVSGQEIVAIGAPLREQKGLSSGTVSRVEPHAIVADLDLATGSAGGPAFAVGGAVVGITSVNEKEDAGRRDTSVVPIADVCEVLASAEKKMTGAPPPNGTHLPVEPAQPFPAAALKDAALRGATPYQISGSDFDIALITPVLTYGAQIQLEHTGSRQGGGTRTQLGGQTVRPLIDFSNWSEYVAEFPPVLLVRVTPKLVEGFWTTVARGAARTQGVALPPIKHFKSGFSRLRAFCGDAEVTPIHPFTLEQRVSETDAIREGLYVFDPSALGPQCASVKLTVYSDKDPGKGDTREVDPKTVQQVWQDFAPFRAASEARPQG